MLSDRSRQGLIDIRDNIRLARSFVGNTSLKDFESDPLKFYAVTRCLEIISEASRRLDQDIRNRHPDFPWREIIGAGNVYRHGYNNVTEDRVWRTVTQELTDLLAMTEAELK
jgi:uncharacterized protein with HEPN domain